MATIDGLSGDMFHMTTSAAIALWNASFLYDTLKKERLAKEKEEHERRADRVLPAGDAPVVAMSGASDEPHEAQWGDSLHVPVSRRPGRATALRRAVRRARG